MAGRALKDGIDYWPFDCGLLRDKKFKLIRGEFGVKGAYVAISLLSAVYEENGYFKVWDDDDCVLMSEGVGDGCTPEFIGEVVRGCVRRSLFDKRVFDMFGVLTSAGIQRRFLRVAGKNRLDIRICSDFWLLDKNEIAPGVLNKIIFFTINSAENSISRTGNTINRTGNATSKVKDSKVQYSRESARASEHKQFELLWKRYPRKDDKTEALKAFMFVNPNEDLFEKMLAAIDDQKKSKQWTTDGGQFVPSFKNWIRKARWNDILPKAKPEINGNGNNKSYDVSEFEKMIYAEDE